MTANDMKFSFQLKFDSLFEFSAPAYDDRQVSHMLTQAQFRIFIKRYNPLGNKYRAGFETNEQRRRDLEQLIRPGSVTTTSTDQTGTHPNGHFYDLPDGFLYAVEEGATQDGASDESWVKPVRHDEYQANKNNPYKQPYKNLVWRMDIASELNIDGSGDASKRTELITFDGAAVTEYRFRYLAMPPDITCDEFDESSQVSCILDETLHGEIVDEAVVMAQAAAQKESYQIGVAEQNRDE